MINEIEFKKRFAKNILLLRKQRGITQSELAIALNYSDKAVSKWERAESLPDTFTVYKIADYFSVSVDSLFSESNEIKTDDNLLRRLRSIRLFVPFICAVGVLFIASIVFLVLKNLDSYESYADFAFLYSLPAIAILMTVFSSIWWKIQYRCICVSLLIWSSAITVYFSTDIENMKYIFVPCAILQAICVLVYTFAHFLMKKD